MQYLLVFLLFLAACGNNCDLLPRIAYNWVLTNKEEDSFECWSQTIKLDLTTDETFAMVFVDTCHVTLIRSCGMTTDLIVRCLGVNLICNYNGLTGNCVNDLDNAMCQYDSQLIPLK